MSLAPSSKYFRHIACEFFPCHDGDFGNHNCLGCFCWFYWDVKCPGKPVELDNGVRSCSSCTWPHQPENYDIAMEIIKNKLTKPKEIADVSNGGNERKKTVRTRKISDQ